LCNRNFEFKCKTNDKCIPIYDVCDSIEHCDDKSDELNCTRTDEAVAVAVSASTLKQTTTTKRIKQVPKLTGKQKPSEDDQGLGTDEEELSKDYAENDAEDDDYDLRLLKQQNEIIEHLKQLEAEKKVDFKTPKGFLDSFFKSELDNQPKYQSSSTSRSRTTKAKTKTTTSWRTAKSSKKIKINFHGNENVVLTVV
jgi:hypothetical protein